MKRFFLGNNTAYGFFGNYEEELRDKERVVLLKGGPGTGKSTILKRLAKEADEKGFEYELWYCSGDPKSLDGVYILDKNVAVVDATAPHATGADLPVIKDVIVDLAKSLKRDALEAHEDEIKKLLNCKKHRFIRAYQHLKLALCHLDNQIALEKLGIDERKIREYAMEFLFEIEGQFELGKTEGRTRNLFVSAICPAGESVFFDYLEGKKIFRLAGCESAIQVFLDEIKKLHIVDLFALNPLQPKFLDGIVVGDVAIVKDAGWFDNNIVGTLDLKEFEHFENKGEIDEEKNGVTLEIAFAVEELNKAREYHLATEKYFVVAMDFENNEKLYDEIRGQVF